MPSISGPPPGSSPAGDLPSRAPALSPSRAADFQRCPLLFRFRVIDKLPEPPSPAAWRGTLVHSVLEHLFDLPAPERTAARALADLRPRWQELTERDESPLSLFPGPAQQEEFLQTASSLLATYFTLEDPRRLEPEARELRVEVELTGGVRLRGIVDRVDVAPGSGLVRVVDYKTGKAPRPQYQHEPLFQLRCYGLALWRLRGQMPAMLQLIYLGDGQIVRAEPAEADLEAAERKLGGLWQAIGEAARSGEWAPSPGPLCRFCAHQAICPQFGGTPPPVPGDAAARLGFA